MEGGREGGRLGGSIRVEGGREGDWEGALEWREGGRLGGSIRAKGGEKGGTLAYGTCSCTFFDPSLHDARPASS